MVQLEPHSALRLPGVEHRIQKRYRCCERKVARVLIKPSFQNFPALIHDLSLNGVGLLLDRPLEAGMVLALHLGGLDPSEPVIRLAQVKHVRPHRSVADAPWRKKRRLFEQLLGFFSQNEGSHLPEAIHLAGCKFDRPLTSIEFRSLCGPLVP